MAGGLDPTRARRLAAEAAGTGFLLATVVGSGIMAERLAGGNVALALLANAVATGAVLVALIAAFGPISGAHLNPAVTLAEQAGGRITAADAAAYVVVQCLAAVAGVWLAHVMFAAPVWQVSRHARTGASQWVSEAVATFGLVSVIRGTATSRPALVPVVVGAYITAAYWFTASTSFANPAVTIARALTDTFAGIRPADVPAFVLSQLAGAAAAVAFWRWLSPPPPVFRPRD